MSTNKELYENKMNTLADIITTKTGVSGKKTIEELTEVVDTEIASKFKPIYNKIYYINTDYAWLINPNTFEEYIGTVESRYLTQEEIDVAIQQICQDYNLVFVDGKDQYLISNELLAPTTLYQGNTSLRFANGLSAIYMLHYDIDPYNNITGVAFVNVANYHDYQIGNCYWPE